MRISLIKKNKIFEQIIFFLYSKSPESVFTSHIAREMARDEEYIKDEVYSKKQCYVKPKKTYLSEKYE
jgi:predicted transcriptional regulator with HTH domain